VGTLIKEFAELIYPDSHSRIKHIIAGFEKKDTF